MWIGKLLIVAANQPSKVGIRSYTLFSDKRKFKLMSSHVTQQFKEPILLTWNLLTWNLPPLFGESWGWHSWTPRPTLDKANDWSLISSPYGTIHLDHLGLLKKHDCLKKTPGPSFRYISACQPSRVCIWFATKFTGRISWGPTLPAIPQVRRSRLENGPQQNSLSTLGRSSQLCQGCQGA